MLSLGPLTSSVGTVYTAAQIGAQLLGTSLQMRWIFDLLSSGGNYKADLTPLVDSHQPATIDHDSEKAVKRSLNIWLWKPAPSLANMAQDLIRVRYQLMMPDGGWVGWRLGEYQCVPPIKTISESASNWKLTAPDLSQLLVDAAFTNSFSVQAGLSCPAAVSAIVSSYGGRVKLRVIIPDNGAVLTGSMSWDAGTSRLAAVNDVLTAFSYKPAWMDGPALKSRPFVDYASVTPAYTFDTTQGVTAALSPIVETPDWSHAFNQFRVIGSDPRKTPPQPVTGWYENDSPLSPTSTISTRPRMAPVINDSKIVDSRAANARARAEAQKAARVYATLSLPFLPWPFGEDLDVYGLVISTPDEGVVARKYLNTNWLHPCAANQATTMSLQRVVAS